MNWRFIKYHTQSNTYVIENRAYFDEALVLDGNVIVGSEVTFWKDLKVEGKLELGKGATVRGNVKANSALLCCRARIFGKLVVSSELSLLDYAKVGAIYCQGDVQVRPGCFIGFIKIEGTLELIGKAKIRDVEPMTKVIVRAEESSEAFSTPTSSEASPTSSNLSSNTISETVSKSVFEVVPKEKEVAKRLESISDEILEKDPLKISRIASETELKIEKSIERQEIN
ncbi:MAG: polymer-forming cytoskeletal protein [Methanosarcinaceae archaeon]|nr:polymer-forming cytoskeletal protein [Methanosarcinaceae archaeon]MDD4749919.1 polymer-forming cytoskeletal protein [Methanosarcinaceae archaeon]